MDQKALEGSRMQDEVINMSSLPQRDFSRAIYLTRGSQASLCHKGNIVGGVSSKSLPCSKAWVLTRLDETRGEGEAAFSSSRLCSNRGRMGFGNFGHFFAEIKDKIVHGRCKTYARVMAVTMVLLMILVGASPPPHSLSN